MEQRRFSLFLILSMGIFLLWMNVAVPRLFPGLVAPQKPQNELGKRIEMRLDAPAADALHPANVESDADAEADIAKVASLPIPNYPPVNILLGPPDPDRVPDGKLEEDADEFFLAAGVTSKGASIDFVDLTDKKKYPAFGQRGERVRVLGGDRRSPLRTFSLHSPEIDKLLGPSSLDQIDWEFVPDDNPNDAMKTVRFRFVSPDGRWELTKRFELTQLSLEDLKRADREDTFVQGYEVKLKITIRNLTDKAQEFRYTLQGPVGVPLEDPDNSYKYRDVRLGFVRDDGNGLDESKVSASEVVKKGNNLKDWKRKIKYIGVDVLYFAALVFPQPDEVESAKAVVANQDPKKPDRSDVSVEMNSPSIEVPGKGEVTHEYTLFAGPKRKELISQISAMAVMDYGWFDSICRGMIWLLNSFHSLGLSYGIAIICLTVLVRTLLMPISKHQAANAAKMKVLQPKLMQKQKELEAKYGKNTEEYMRAASELSKEQFGLMLSGCLPAFLQLPIFIALYRAIGSSIELRMEPFLWFENLASPDALFKFPFVISLPLPFIYPWPEWTHFNLLPCISTLLMFFHQKLTMPPPTTDEQAQQQKMMNFMMIFMGAMFFRVPSGLCLYFIATNIWSMTERWIFEHSKKTIPPDTEGPLVVSAPSPSPAPVTGGGRPSAFGEFWSRLQEAADNQKNSTRQLGNQTANRDEKKRKKR